MAHFGVVREGCLSSKGAMFNGAMSKGAMSKGAVFNSRRFQLDYSRLAIRLPKQVDPRATNGVIMMSRPQGC